MAAPIPEPGPGPLNLALTWLRCKLDWTQRRLTEALGWRDNSLLSKLESGVRPLTRRFLREILAPLPLEDPEGAVGVLEFAHEMIFPARPEDPASPLTPEERKRMNRAALATALAAAEAMRADWQRRKKAEKTAAARREAEDLWPRLQAASPADRRDAILTFPCYRSVALAARVCEASVRAAAGKAGKARELAELALFIAGRVEGGVSLRSRAQGYCWAFIGNARRIAEEFDGADEAFARTWKLWEAGVDCELLPESRLLDLEASLRRAERRFPEALKLLDRARKASGEDPIAVSRILVIKAGVLNFTGDLEGSLAALEEAAPFVEASGNPDLLYALRFNTAEDLCGLARYDEVASLLPQVRELALEQHSERELSRVLWLQAKLDAGLGRFEEAVRELQLVRRNFLDQDLPYLAALASLDLAVLWLQAGRTAEVRELAAEMAAVFRAKKIRREALAALLIFCDAAKQETATVELARRALAEIEKARRSASPAE